MQNTIYFRKLIHTMKNKLQAKGVILNNKYFKYCWANKYIFWYLPWWHRSIKNMRVSFRRHSHWDSGFALYLKKNKKEEFIDKLYKAINKLNKIWGECKKCWTQLISLSFFKVRIPWVGRLLKWISRRIRRYPLTSKDQHSNRSKFLVISRKKCYNQTLKR